MSKNLIINIDVSNRSLYSLVAATGTENSPEKYTLITTKGNEALKGIGRFENIHFLDVEQLFKSTKNLSDDSLEKEVKRLLAPTLNTEWDVVINLSSNLLGTLITHFLKYKKIRGSYLDTVTGAVSFSDMFSFVMTNIPNETDNFLHFTYLYQGITGSSCHY